MTLNYEFEKRLRVGYVGGGDQSYRNFLPSFQYAPIELVALVDHDADRGLAVARQFGAQHFYPNYKAMLAKEKMDAVFIVMGPDDEGNSPNPVIGADALRAGFHVWVAAPPCSSSSEISKFTDACLVSHKFVTTGFKRMFAPAYEKVAEIVDNPEFGGVSSFSMRYPVHVLPKDDRSKQRATSPLLEFVHPYSLLVRLFGECEGFCYLRSDASDAVLLLSYRKGYVGTLHLTAGQANTSPLERLEVVGQGANVVVENTTRLTYYRTQGHRGSPNDDLSFIGPDAGAPIVWEPEFSLGNSYNKQLVLEGYVGCVNHFAQRLLADQAPKHGNLVDMLHIMSFCSKLSYVPEKQWQSVY